MDLDGTILDSLGVWDEVDRRMFLKYDRVRKPGFAEVVSKMTIEESSEYIRVEYQVPLTAEEIKEDMLLTVRKLYEEEVPMKPIAEKMLATIRKSGLPMVMATTNDREAVEATLKRLGIVGDFKALLTSSEVGDSKREPTIYLKAAEALYTDAIRSQTLVVEDSLHCIETAKKAGFTTMAVYDEFNKADWEATKALADYYVGETWEDSKLPNEISSRE